MSGHARSRRFGAVKVLSNRFGAVRVLSKSGAKFVARPTRLKLTEAMCRSAVVPSGKSQMILWEGAVRGLGLRCLSGGSRTWIYIYRSAGGGRNAPSQTLRLGSWPEVTADAARKAASRHAGAV